MAELRRVAFLDINTTDRDSIEYLCMMLKINLTLQKCVICTEH